MRFPALMLLLPAVVLAQAPPDVAAERADVVRWLTTSATSPYAGIYHQPFTGDLVFGPGGAAGLESVTPATLHQGLLRLTLDTPDGDRTVPRNRDVPLGDRWHLRVSGDRSRSTVTVFGPVGVPEPPGWFPYDSAFTATGVLEPPPRPESRRMLGLDGVEVEAIHAGTWVGSLAGTEVRLTVFRIPESGSEESDLTIFFRDATNGVETYPAGRFLALRPLGDSRYLADFNRARNPFCGYNGIFPCPAPWPGNALQTAVTAGERYRHP